MQPNGYWARELRKRLSRRRALAATGAGSAALAFLAACGGKGSDSGGSSRGSSLVVEPADTTAQAKRGGTFRSNDDRPFTTFDPYQAGTTGSGRDLAYQRLLMVKPGLLKPAVSGEVQADLAQSWEYSGDNLQLTVKLQPEAHFDPRPPTSGRLVEADDVVFSINRLLAIGGRRAEWFNSLNPDNALQSWSAPDKSTAIMKLAHPDPGFVAMLANNSSSYLHVMPKETGGGFNPDGDTRGSGPFILGEYVPSSHLTWKRNPGYWNKQFPLVDQVEWPIISDYAAGLAQFRTGATYDYAVTSEDILPTKSDVPALQMYANDVTSVAFRTFWGFKDSPKSQFRDERLRQAFALALDRDLWVDTFFNVAKFRNQGLPVQSALSTAMRPEHSGWWLDPKGKDFGQNAIYYTHDVAEAKRLLTAAGFPTGVDIDAYFVTTGEYGRDLNKWTEAMYGMAQDAGFRITTHGVNFATEWRPRFTTVKGNFEGISNIQDSGPPDLGGWLYSHYNANGALFEGFSDDGRSSFSGDPYLNDITSKLRSEFDSQKRIAMAQDLQRYEAKKQYYPMYPGGANTFLLFWPALRNIRVYQGATTNQLYYWIDPTKAPLT